MAATVTLVLLGRSRAKIVEANDVKKRKEDRQWIEYELNRACEHSSAKQNTLQSEETWR